MACQGKSSRKEIFYCVCQLARVYNITMSKKQVALKLRLKGLTYQEVGRRLGISRQRVQQLIRPPREIYNLVHDRAKGRCEDCGIALPHMHNGHVHHENSVDIHEEDFNDVKNLVYLCWSCHRKRHN